MLILRLSLIMAVNLAVVGARSHEAPLESNTTPSSVMGDASGHTGAETFSSEWGAINITLNRNSTISYRVDDVNLAENITGNTTPNITANQLILAQTNAEPSEPITQTNTWWILQLQSCKTTTCEPLDLVYGGEAYNELNYTFHLQGQEDKPLSGFFFCIADSSYTLGPYPDIACRSYSPIFDINPADTSQRPSSPGQVSGRQASAPDENTAEFSESSTLLVQTRTPTSVLMITSMDPYINFAGAIPTSASVLTSTIVVQTTTTSPTPTPNSVGGTAIVSSAGSGEGKKLSVGAIVGIALGAFVLAILIALAVIFFCRRSKRHHRTRLASSGAGPGQVMLAGSTDGGSNSREFNDKDVAVQTLIHPNSNDSSFLPQDSNNRHSMQRHMFNPEGTAAYRDSPHDSAVAGNGAPDSSAFRDAEHSDHENETQPLQPHADLNPYGSSAPYAGNAASPPRRKPTAASHKTAVSALSHTLSSSSTHSSQPPHSPPSQYADFPHPPSHQHVSQLRDIGEEGGGSGGGTSPTHNTSTSTSTTTTTTKHHNNNKSSSSTTTDGAPRYCDTRHTPQVFTHIPSSSRQSPFLSEPGMSPEEVARLEEEEARIDAAILAADEARRNNRPGSGLR